MKINLFVAEILIGLCLLTVNTSDASNTTDTEKLASVSHVTKTGNGEETTTNKGKIITSTATPSTATPSTATTTKKKHSKKDELEEKLIKTSRYGVIVSCVACLLIGAGIALCCVFCWRQRKKKRQRPTSMEMSAKHIQPEGQSHNMYQVVSDASHSGGSGHALTSMQTHIPGYIPNQPWHNASSRFVQPHSGYTIVTPPHVQYSSHKTEGHYCLNTPKHDYFVLEANSTGESRSHGEPISSPVDGQLAQERPLPSVPEVSGSESLPRNVLLNRGDVRYDLASSYPPGRQDMQQRNAHVKTDQPLVSGASGARDPVYVELE